jgi:peptidyl-prolyl cis-trans isomerase SurA
LDGADFAELAKAHSEDAYRRSGGAMDWMAQGELLPELDQALFTLRPGELSEPIRSSLGFHLLRVEERRSAASLSVLEANRAVYHELYQQKFEEVLHQWLTDLIRQAYIRVVEA